MVRGKGRGGQGSMVLSHGGEWAFRDGDLGGEIGIG